MGDNIFERATRCISLRLIERYFATKEAKYHDGSGEYATLSPLRHDEHVKSGTFSINVFTGLWHDKATGEGGNFIDLVAKAFGLTKKEAAEKIIADSGGYMPTKKEKKKKKPAIIPVPEEAKNTLPAKIKEKYFLDKYGEPVAIYPYRNYEGGLVLCTCRYERDIGKSKKDKSVIPFYYTVDGWEPGRPENVRIPLFHENKLRDNILPVIFTEGEKCANVEVEGFVNVTWLGGTGSIEEASFDALDGREVYIWPDADMSGLKAAQKIAEKIPSAKILKIENKPKGWDIADAVDEGINPAEFIQQCIHIIEENEKEQKVEATMTPYEAFHAARKHLYGDNNLEQIDGIFYIYCEQKHYWQERLKINIESDIQKWIETHQIDFLLNSDKSVHTFIQNTISFLGRYSRKFYHSNPFKDSVLKPFIHVRNGAIEITDEGFIFHDRSEKGEDFFRELYPLHCLDFDFDIELYNRTDLPTMAPAFYHYIKSLVPEGIEHYEAEVAKTTDFFSQVIAYCINPIKRKPRFFALYGGQNTGKSFFIELLQTIIGSEFFVSRRIKDMDNRFASSDLWGAKIFVDDDVKANLALPDDFIKNFSGQRNITIEKKNKDSIKGVRISVAMFFISNHAFSVAGGVEGLERRLVYIPYKKKIKKPDVFLLDKICGIKKKGDESKEQKNTQYDERPAILGFALRGIDLLIQNDFDFITPQWVENERSEWVISSSSITQFLHEEIYCGSVDSYRPKVLYDMYSDWCVEEKRTAYGRNNFYEKLKLEDRITFVHTRDGDIVRIKLDDSDSDSNIIEENDNDDDVIPF